MKKSEYIGCLKFIFYNKNRSIMIERQERGVDREKVLSWRFICLVSIYTGMVNKKCETDVFISGMQISYYLI